MQFTISGLKYTDHDGLDNQTAIGADDTFLGGVTIDLFNHDSGTNTNTLITTQVTSAADGSYSFTGLGPLAAGHSYFVQEEKPSGDTETFGAAGYTVAATSGNTQTGDNFANFVQFSISGLKYTDHDGLDNQTAIGADDTFLGGVTIDLFNHDSGTNTNTLITTQVTSAADGSYSFTGLGPLAAGHSYFVQEEKPSGDTETFGAAGYTVAATSGNTKTGDNFANFVQFSISGLKYTDHDGLDNQTAIGADDTFLGGVTIDLFNHDSGTNTNTLITTQVTSAADGSYSFTGLGPLAAGHSYFVQEEKPSGDTETFGAAGYTVAATSGNTQTGDNFANFVQFSISGLKYTDHDGLDNQTAIGADDTFLGGVTIDLFNHDSGTNTNTLITTQVTSAADGSYSFTGLGPLAAGHSYFVQEEKPSGDTETFGAAGYTVAATSGNTQTGDNFANFVQFSISGLKYTDHDGLDNQTAIGADDTFLGGVTIDLFNHDSGTNTNTLITTQVTSAADGSYSFTGLGPLAAGHSYFVQEEKPSGDTETFGAAGYTVAATSGNTQTGDNFANFVQFSISGLKYTDHDGLDNQTAIGADDTFLGGVTIDLFNHDSGTNTNTLITTQVTSAADGSYSFTGLGPLAAGHSYFVQEEKPSGDTETFGAAGYTVAATSGNTQTGDNFANFVQFSISGLKYTDHDGLDNQTAIGADDTFLGGVTIDLFNHDSGTNTNTLITTQVTSAADGSYSFTGLGPLAAGHSYFVQEEKPSGDTETFGAAGYTVAATSGNTTDRRQLRQLRAVLDLGPQVHRPRWPGQPDCHRRRRYLPRRGHHRSLQS